MIYLDTSVALAHILVEDRRPSPAFWEDQLLVSSRLLEYEMWNRLCAKQLHVTHRREALATIDRVDFIEITQAVLRRALDPFPVPSRTLDGLHLATMEYLRFAGQTVELATYDERLLKAARALGIEPLPL